MTFEINYTVQLPGEAQVRERSFLSDELTWAPLADGNVITLPAYMFTPNSAVSDEAVGYWDGETLSLVERPLTNGDLVDVVVVLVVVESPHVSEYGQPFCPIAPLQDPRTRERLRTCLPQHLHIMGVPGRALVVACNPVQWQASLGSLRPPRTRPGEIRTVMWRALFDAGWRMDFERRLAAYRPGWILNACTKELKADVYTSLVNTTVPIWEASHPSSLWFRLQLAKQVR